MQKSIIIVGGGIAGLAAGCYGRMNGYETQIFEMHNLPGGLCTAWQRKGYTFDGCIHWLVGSKKGSSMYKMWEELGAVQGREFVNYPEFTRIKGEDGKTFILHADVDNLEKHMKELSPQDSSAIEEWCKVIRELSSFDTPVDVDELGLGQKLKALTQMWPFIKNLIKYRKVSVQEFAAKIKDPFLRNSINSIFGLEDFPVLFLLMTLAWMNAKSAGFPIGGSLDFAQGIEKRYLELGGKIHYKAPVAKILVEGHKATGIRLADGREFFADYIISAADGHKTIFEMLEGQYIDDKIRGYYGDMPIFKPLVQVSLGVNRDLSKEPHSITVPLESPIKIAGKEHGNMGVKHHCYDQTLAPEGKSTVIVKFETDYDYWSKLRQNEREYTAEKDRIGSEVINRLEELLPGISSQVEVLDVATPLSYERYTGNWRGSMEGWLITTKNLGLKMSKTLPGLDNFFMAGQWVEPGGGVPTAALSGRKAVKMICKLDKKEFSAVV